MSILAFKRFTLDFLEHFNFLLNNSVRSTTPILNHLDPSNWEKIIIFFKFLFKKKRFYPIDKTIYRKPYEPLMLTRDKYKLLDYGRKYFREEVKSQDPESVSILLNLID